MGWSYITGFTLLLLSKYQNHVNINQDSVFVSFAYVNWTRWRTTPVNNKFTNLNSVLKSSAADGDLWWKYYYNDYRTPLLKWIWMDVLLCYTNWKEIVHFILFWIVKAYLEKNRTKWTLEEGQNTGCLYALSIHVSVCPPCYGCFHLNIWEQCMIVNWIDWG